MILGSSLLQLLSFALLLRSSELFDLSLELSTGFLFSWILSLIYSFISSVSTGVSKPAESNKTIFLFLYSSISGYFILKPSVLISAPDGNLILDNLDNIKDLPLLLFPMIPILITFIFLYFW